MSKKDLVFVTGTRADFGKIEPLALAANKSFNVSFFVTGMHMMEAYGLTKIEVHRTQNVRVYEFLNQRYGDNLDSILIKTMSGFSDFIHENSPDLVIIHGDRVEALACALVCSMNYIRCAHIEGGEVSGTIDEIFRHCNSKLSYCHFASSEIAAKRLMALGETRDSIYVIGSPELDYHSKPSNIDLKDVLERYQIKSSEFAICIFHPVTSEIDSIKKQASDLFSSLASSNKYFVVIKPNNDPGSEQINHILEGLDRSKFRVLPSIRFSYFSVLMKHSKCIIGNSSAGVREAPFIGVSSLDIGSRQTNRSNASSVFKAKASEDKKIQSFLKTQWGHKYSNLKEFGNGKATEKFMKIIKSKEFWNKPFQKTFQDINE